MNGYFMELRKAVGHSPLIVPSIRAIIQDDEGNVLFLKSKRDSWVMPAGAIELNESIYETLVREVKEETGIDVQAATLITIYTCKPLKTNKFGDPYQMFEFLFRVDIWSGQPFGEHSEYKEGRFFAQHEWPVDQIEDDYWRNHFREVFEDFTSYNGKCILK